jgi:asparagine synthetase B (glutamine-hydrolysing)
VCPPIGIPIGCSTAITPGFWAFDWQNAWRRDVLVLMPGHALEVRLDGRLRRWRWHDWGPPPEPFRGDVQDAADAFGEALRQSVRDRLRNVDAIGVIASGGIDSLSVLRAASEERAGRSH